METTDPLADFFTAEAAPTSDRAFRVGVMEKIARRRLRIELVLRLCAGLLLVIGLALMAPAVQGVAELLGRDMATVLPVVAVGIGTAFLGHAWLTRPIALPRLF
jgi:hypothetical protein